jgi:hypothetical protein
VSLDAEPALAKLLNAGSRIDIWNAEKPLLEDAKVVALLCRKPGDTTCAIALNLSETQRRALARGPASERRILIREISP